MFSFITWFIICGCKKTLIYREVSGFPTTSLNQMKSWSFPCSGISIRMNQIAGQGKSFKNYIIGAAGIVHFTHRTWRSPLLRSPLAHSSRSAARRSVARLRLSTTPTPQQRLSRSRCSKTAAPPFRCLTRHRGLPLGMVRGSISDLLQLIVSTERLFKENVKT